MKSCTTGCSRRSTTVECVAPMAFNQCSKRSEVRLWVNNKVFEFLKKFRRRVDSETGFTNMLMKVASLTESDGPMALQSGLFYETVVMVYPQVVLQRHLYTLVRQHFEVIRNYDLGGSIEFLVVS